MRSLNVLLFASPILVAIVVAVFVGVGWAGSALAFFVVLDMAISFLIMALFLDYWRLGKRYERSVLALARERGNAAGHRVAVVVPTFNEPPRMVAETAVAAMMAVGSQGSVYVLDDSTDEGIRRRLDFYARQMGFAVFRRGNRKGYKAGAVNAWLREHGKDYDFLIIVDSDQRLMPGILDYTLKFFDDPHVAFVQVPQYYSGLGSAIALAAHVQQIPFLRTVMRGRSVRGSAFSLGSGTIYRTRSLLEIGGLDENTVTEDVSTSLDL